MTRHLTVSWDFLINKWGKKRLNYSGINGDFLRAVTNDSLQLQRNALHDFLHGSVLGTSQCNLTWIRKQKGICWGRRRITDLSALEDRI